MIFLTEQLLNDNKKFLNLIDDEIALNQASLKSQKALKNILLDYMQKLATSSIVDTTNSSKILKVLLSFKSSLELSKTNIINLENLLNLFNDVKTMDNATVLNTISEINSTIIDLNDELFKNNSEILQTLKMTLSAGIQESNLNTNTSVTPVETSSNNETTSVEPNEISKTNDLAENISNDNNTNETTSTETESASKDDSSNETTSAETVDTSKDSNSNETTSSETESTSKDDSSNETTSAEITDTSKDSIANTTISTEATDSSNDSSSNKTISTEVTDTSKDSNSNKTTSSETTDTSKDSIANTTISTETIDNSKDDNSNTTTSFESTDVSKDVSINETTSTEVKNDTYKKEVNKENIYKHISTNDINSFKETVAEPITIQENTLIISERTNKVFLPYDFTSLETVFKNNPHEYTSVEDIIRKDFIKPLELFKIPSISRFRESYKLMREKENRSFKEAFELAIELFFNYNLHPAIISACRNLDELDIYLDYLADNETHKFNCFNIVFEVAPTTISKHSMRRKQN